MSNLMIKFKLKQHTPILHFQHDQTGATLRATELKPKLDKFLKKKCPDLPFGEKGNLDYKVNIMSKNIEIEDITLPKKDRNGQIKINRKGEIQRNLYPLFFANTGTSKENYKKACFTKSVIDLHIFSFSKEIRNAIKTYLADFLLQTNFGTRQSKGFGSFYIDEADIENYKKPNLKYMFQVDKTNFRDVFTYIELFYSTLRAGINRCNKTETTFYFKSLMFLYAKNRGIQWDKKSIKEQYLVEDLKKQNKKHGSPDIISYSSDKKHLMKDLLGLSTNETWMSYSSNITKKREHKDIERFKSPIIFKPLMNSRGNGFNVFFYTKEIDPNFLGQSFEITCNKSSHLNLSTPSSFDVDDFLNFALKTDLDAHVQEPRFRDHRDFKIIKSIYNDINKNVRSYNGK